MMIHSVLYYIVILAGVFIFQVYAQADAQKYIEEQQLKHIEESSVFDMTQTFRKPKKIAFSCLQGGSSHIHWVLSILDELHKRGHETSFITKGTQLKFSKKHPHIKSISIGELDVLDNSVALMRELRNKSKFEAGVMFMELLIAPFEEDFKNLTRLIESEEYDLILCDSFNYVCHEAAYAKGIPFVVTSSFPLGFDVSAPYINNEMSNMDIPTTQYMSLWERFDKLFISPAKLMWRLRGYIAKKRALYKSLGIQITHPFEKWRDSIKLLNSAFGIHQGRPIGPLVEFVGPIVKHHIPSMSPDLQAYFSNHKSVAYIAFGQHAVMSRNDVQLIINGLLEAYENEEIDGIVWATRGLEETFPDIIVTQSNTTYDVKGFFDYNNQSDIMFLSWAPQMSILSHPSTSLFISHGGSGSLYESLYSGVRMVIYPFFGDQPGASITGEKNGYALRLSQTATQEEATRIIRTVAKDENNEFQKNANRFQALLQIGSKHGTLKGADVVEEALFMHVNGKITHRRDVKNDMSFIKAYNIDVYAIIAVICLGIFYITSNFLIYVSRLIITRPPSNKLKQKTL